MHYYHIYIILKNIAINQQIKRRVKALAFKDESGNKTWFCKFNYTNWKGENWHKKK